MLELEVWKKLLTGRSRIQDVVTRRIEARHKFEVFVKITTVRVRVCERERVSGSVWVCEWECVLECAWVCGCERVCVRVCACVVTMQTTVNLTASWLLHTIIPNFLKHFTSASFRKHTPKRPICQVANKTKKKKANPPHSTTVLGLSTLKRTPMLVRITYQYSRDYCLVAGQPAAWTVTMCWLIYPLYTQNFRSYLTENTARLHYNSNRVVQLRKKHADGT